MGNIEQQYIIGGHHLVGIKHANEICFCFIDEFPFQTKLSINVIYKAYINVKYIYICINVY